MKGDLGKGTPIPQGTPIPPHAAAEAADPFTPSPSSQCFCEAKPASQRQPSPLPLCELLKSDGVSQEPSEFPTLWPHSQC